MNKIKLKVLSWYIEVLKYLKPYTITNSDGDFSINFSYVDYEYMLTQLGFDVTSDDFDMDKMSFWLNMILLRMPLILEVVIEKGFIYQEKGISEGTYEIEKFNGVYKNYIQNRNWFFFLPCLNEVKKLVNSSTSNDFFTSFTMICNNLCDMGNEDYDLDFYEGIIGFCSNSADPDNRYSYFYEKVLPIVEKYYAELKGKLKGRTIEEYMDDTINEFLDW